MKTLEEVIAILKDTQRTELRNLDLGNREITWLNAEGQAIAEGYRCGKSSFVSFVDGTYQTEESDITFVLGHLGTLSKVEYTKDAPARS